ncbi:MAG: hypothetical protein J7604_03780 [Sporocytophaga sp.]|uniref:hypothetical protein n=1 Tax=Sporocytophaga sp. TaxID=2231183 RepID=UPI001B1D6EB2|nr:hypothetical protein [Sporocytophaga sp.]MBO9699302.1 hypothetical protein [Sporocytophaga sp.]
MKKRFFILLLLIGAFNLTTKGQISILEQNFDDPSLEAFNFPSNMTIWSKGGTWDYVTNNNFNGSKHLKFTNQFDRNWYFIVSEPINTTMYDSLVITFDIFCNNNLTYFISEENKDQPYGNHYNFNDSTKSNILYKGKVNSSTSKFYAVVYPSKGIYRYQISFVETPDLSILELDNILISSSEAVVSGFTNPKPEKSDEIHSVYSLDGKKLEITDLKEGYIYIFKYKSGKTIKTNWN